MRRDGSSKSAALARHRGRDLPPLAAVTVSLAVLASGIQAVRLLDDSERAPERLAVARPIRPAAVVRPDPSAPARVRPADRVLLLPKPPRPTPPIAEFSGPVLGPTWERLPLPAATPTARAASKPPAGDPSGPPPGGPAPSPLSSELPDAETLALSRLANPAAETRRKDAPPAAQRPTAERPLGIRLTAGDAGRAYREGELIPLRLTATADCYVLVVRVDASGRASTAFLSPAPGRSFACVVRAGSAPGAEYYLALASARPPAPADVTGALQGQPPAFTAVPAAEAKGDAGPAWTAAVQHAAQAAEGPPSGGAAKWERFEWALAAGTVAVQPQSRVAGARSQISEPAPAKPAALKSPAAGEGKPAAAEGSVLP